MIQQYRKRKTLRRFGGTAAVVSVWVLRYFLKKALRAGGVHDSRLNKFRSEDTHGIKVPNAVVTQSNVLTVFYAFARWRGSRY